jgi:eukaryotic-like serine/threonine-protein kinase
MSLAAGTRLGPYEVIASLGAGGMGEVYRATDTRLGREVAIKVLPASAAGSPDAQARFEREARAIAALSHPNICTLYDVGTSDGHPYLVMELLAGETLHDRLARGSMPIAATVDHAIALADALDTAHARGIIHRDIKPANIFVTTNGVMKILDFGLAKADERADQATRTIQAALTGPGTAIGTLSYMSPEQLRGEVVDARTDLFSLGLVLYEMLTGQRAFGGRTSAEVSAAILKDDPPSPVSLRADVPARLDDIVLKALEKDVELRYHSASELRGDLKRFKRQLDPSATLAPASASSSKTAAVPVSAPPPSSSDAALAVGLVRRHPLALVAATLVVVAAAVGAWWYSSHRSANSAPAAAPEITMQALTVDGYAQQATISPDGKFIAYVRRDGVRSSVVVKQLGSNSDVVILPPSDEVNYWAPSVTPDGNYVDVLVAHRGSAAREIVRVPFLGGSPRTIVSNVASGLGWSSDGSHMAYVVWDPATQTTTLVVADASGQQAKVLLRRKDPVFLSMLAFNHHPPSRPSWSPDGRHIVVGSQDLSPERQQSKTGGELLEVDVNTGAVDVLARNDDFFLEAAYLDADRVIASVQIRGVEQWWLFPRGGAPVQLTHDLSRISGVRLTSDRTAGVATRSTLRTSIEVGPIASGRFDTVVPESAAAPDGPRLDAKGALYYDAEVPGRQAIFRRDPSGATTELLQDAAAPPLPSADGRFLVALTGDGRLVRMNSDGSNTTTLVTDPTASPVAFTADGSALVFSSNRLGNQEPWLLPLAGGEPKRLAPQYLSGSMFWVALDNAHAILTGRTGTTVCRFPSFDDCRSLDVEPGPYSADGRYIYAVDPRDPKNLIAQPIAGGPPVPLTHFTDETIQDFSFSPDHRTIAITRGTNESDVVLVKFGR